MKLGIIGYGAIVREFLPGLSQLPGVDILAVLGKPGREDVVTGLCKEYQIPHPVFDFSQLLDTGVDTVYIAVPNHLHFAYSKTALEAGLNVIVEKPMVSNHREACILQKLAMEQKLFLFEAITTLYLPGYERIRQWLPRIGAVRLVQGQFVKYSRRYDDFCQGRILPVFDPQKSGGALMDLNVYNLHFMTGLFGMPGDLCYNANMEHGIDTGGVLILKYPGFTAICTAAKDCAELRSCSIHGTLGAIYADDAPSCIGNVTLELADGTKEYYPDPHPSQRYLLEFSKFRDAIAAGELDFCYAQLSHSVALCRLLDQARDSANIRFPADSL